MTDNNNITPSVNRLNKARKRRALFFVLIFVDIAASYLLSIRGAAGLPVSILWIIQLYLVIKYYQSDVSVMRYAGTEENGLYHKAGVIMIVGMLTAWIVTERRVRGWFIVDAVCYGYLLYFTVLNLFLRRPDSRSG